MCEKLPFKTSMMYQFLKIIMQKEINLLMWMTIFKVKAVVMAESKLAVIFHAQSMNLCFFSFNLNSVVVASCVAYSYCCGSICLFPNHLNSRDLC